MYQVCILRIQRHTTHRLDSAVGFNEPKYKLLRLARKLKDSEGYVYAFINPDLTKSERLEQFRLRLELRKKKLNGEDDLVIYNNYIAFR